MLHMQITEFKYDCFDPILPFFGGKSSKIESGIYYYHADHLGSSTVVTDKNGKFHEHLEYFPYGETWINDRANNENLPYKFTGKELDPETGLYYFGARYYDSRLSRWISADDRMDGLFDTQGANIFSYVRANPVKYIDPDGHQSADAAYCWYKAQEEAQANAEAWNNGTQYRITGGISPYNATPPKIDSPINGQKINDVTTPTSQGGLMTSPFKKNRIWAPLKTIFYNINFLIF